MQPNTLADVLRPVSRFLPTALLSNLSWQQALTLAAQLPALLCPYSFGFEMPLHLPLTHVDLAFCITQPGCDILAETYPGVSSSALLDDPRVWPNLKSFCRIWGNPSSGLFQQIENLWLEFRLQNKDAYLYPIPFIRIKKNTDPEKWLPDALRLLLGKKIPDQVTNNLSDFLKKLPPDVYPFQAGIYEQDDECRVRLCLEGLTVNDLLRFLKSIGNNIYPVDDGVLTSMQRICVHIDIGRCIGSTIGIELRQAPEKELTIATQPEWDSVLELLEQKKLCLSENSTFLSGFRGSSYEMIHPDLAQFATYRFLYYLKAVLVPGRPLRVKAYFGFVNRTFVPELPGTVSSHYGIHNRLSKENITSAIRRAVTFLCQNQLPNGEFKTYISGDERLAKAMHDSSPFVTSFVLYCTRYLPAGLFDLPRQKAKLFLLKEGFPGYLWKYWTHTSNKTIVPDLDDTCCVSFILQELFQRHDVKRNIPAILTNRDDLGLFKTWIKQASEPNDADISVNTNVLLYLGKREETEAAIAFVKECIKKGEEKNHSWYYPDNLACYYMIARAARHGISDFRELFPAIKERVLERRNPDGGWGDELSTALAVCALHYIDKKERAIETALLHLVNKQQANGCWTRISFYSGPEPPAPRSVWFGSEELTTALCIEALWGLRISNTNELI
jgi:hypothetical protein